MRQLAQDHGQAGWHAHAFPLSVDGIDIVASLVVLASRRQGRRPGWLPWAALIIGTAASLAANIATARPDLISRTIAGWPAIALILALKLLSGLLEHPEPATRQPAANPTRRTASTRARRRPASSRSPHLPAPNAELLTAARAAWHELARDGRPPTRDALAARLRADGHHVRNASLSPLLTALRTETAPTL